MTFCDSADDITMTCTAAYFLPLHKCTGDAGWESTMLYDSVSQVNLLPPDCHLVIIGGNCDLCVFVYFETPLYIAVQGLQWGAGVQWPNMKLHCAEILFLLGNHSLVELQLEKCKHISF